MDRQTAEKVVSLIEGTTARLNEALILAEQNFSKDDFEHFRGVIANILVELQADALKTVYAHHRDLDKYGYSR